MNKTRILLVEDDTYLGFMIKDLFEARDFDVEHYTNAEDALKAYSKSKADICIFDVMLPDMDGFGLAREIRNIDKKTPMIFLTAKSLKEDVVEGFKIGADDYIKKPFNMEELILRVQAILRRKGGGIELDNDKKIYNIGEFEFDYLHKTLKSKTKEYILTQREAELLKLFAINVNSVLDRKVVLKELWDDDSFFNARSMDVYIAKLRKYFKEDPDIEIINIRGKGFKLFIDHIK